MQQEEICNIFLVSDRRLNQAFMKDMSTQGAFVHAKRSVEIETKEDSLITEFLERRGTGGTEGGQGEKSWGQKRKSQLPSCGDSKSVKGWRNGPEPPPSGCATMDFVQEALPELQRLAKKLER